MDDSLTCCICREVLKNPRQLPCDHTCCHLCLQSYYLNHADSSNKYMCPVCDKPLPVPDPDQPLAHWINSFPVAISAAKKLENNLWLYEATVKEKCAICLKNQTALTATKYCKTCEEYYCDECGNKHWLLLASKPHRVMFIEDFENLKNDPLLRAEMTAVFSSKIKCARLKSPRNGFGSPRSNSPRNDRLSPRGNSPGNRLLPPAHASPKNGQSSVRSRSKSPLGNLLSPHSPRMTPQSTDIDSEDSKIIAVTFMSDGCIVLSDENNNKLKLFDRNYRFLTSIDAVCWSLLTLNGYLFAGTCPKENCVKFFKVFGNFIETDSVLDLKQPCYGLCGFANDLAVACSGAEIKIKILDCETQTEIRSIKIDTGKLHLRKPENLCFHFTNGRNVFYVSDSNNKCLKCVSEDGSVIWERVLKDLTGLVVYGPYVLVGRSEHQTVDVLNTDGQCLKSIVDVEDGLSAVKALAVEAPGSADDTGERLAVTDESDLVRIFSLMDPKKEDDFKGQTIELQQTDAKRTTRNSRLCNIV